MLELVIDGASYNAEAGEHLIDVINRTAEVVSMIAFLFLCSLMLLLVMIAV
jgi:hypothetical protein